MSKRLVIPAICLQLLVLVGTGSCSAKTEKEESLLRKEVADDLVHNILPFWATYAPDPRGGFYGALNYDGSPLPDAEKGEVLNARILWTFSSAYRILGNESYKLLADRAGEYFIQHFVDSEYGGVYWSVHADGTPRNTEKQVYGIAYAIYAFSEHYRATGNEESLKQAISQFQVLEQYAYDSQNGGYIESFTRDWMKPEKYGYDGQGIAAKTMNTHLHVLEAYTNLYRVWPDELLRKQLRGLIELFTDKIIDKERWHEKLFLTMDWQNLEDIDSYGHDMELAWLITEASEALGDEELIAEIEKVAINLVDIQLKEGWTEAGALLYEKAGGVYKTDFDWWPQAETVVAFVNAWQITQKQEYLDAAIKTWEWIKKYMIDYEYGEWYSYVRTDGTPYAKRQKASLWRCPYHNSRMGLEIFTRLD